MFQSMPGPTFLFVYLAILVVTFIGVRLIHRGIARTQNGEDANPSLGPLEAAYLVGGPVRATLAALAALTKIGKIQVTEGTPATMAYHGPPPSDPFQSAVAQELGGGTLKTLVSKMDGKTREIRDSLVKKGLLIAPETLFAMWGLTLAAYFPLAYVSLERYIHAGSRPVGFLHMLNFVAGISFCICLATAPKRSSMGTWLSASCKATMQPCRRPRWGTTSTWEPPTRPWPWRSSEGPP